MRLPIVTALLACLAAHSEEFSSEPFLLGSSVANNGTSSSLPSGLYTATHFLDFPGDFGEAKTFRLELANLPVFGNLSQTWEGAMGYALDSHTHMSVFGQWVTTSDIQLRPVLQGTYEDRLNNPGFRPEPCNGCATFSDKVYLVSLNFMRKYDTEFPRLDISSRPIPIQFSAGLTTKYFFEELEGGDYTAQNMNIDAGLCMTFFWGFNPVDKTSDRNIKIQFTGLEILPTKQQSKFGNVLVYEDMSYRWRMSLSWEEGLPLWNSSVALGATQKSEGGTYPGLGLEYDVQKMLFVRTGWDSDFISAGASLNWRWVSVHYAFRYHDLGSSMYQVSGQVQWP